MFLLGDTFLRSFYSVFDFDNQMVQLGVNVHAKDYVSMRKRLPAWRTLKVYLMIMLPIILILQIIYQFLTRKIYADMIESLDMYEIT